MRPMIDARRLVLTAAVSFGVARHDVCIAMLVLSPEQLAVVDAICCFALEVRAELCCRGASRT